MRSRYYVLGMVLLLVAVGIRMTPDLVRYMRIRSM